MSGPTPIRDPQTDHLITPQNAVITFIDYQPEQYAGVHSIDTKTLLAGVITLGEIATSYGLPVVLSTVGVGTRGMKGTNEELKAALPGVPEIDRTTLNSWEDPEFRAAVEATGRRKLIVAGLWTEICVAFPVLDALKEGYDVYFVADAIGGLSTATHEAAMQRMIQAGAKPISVIGLAGELQRDWGREGADKLRAALGGYFGRMR
ncbi:hydrolase [Solilutibacter tolerans]|uniref:Nicotinamidase-related amidase n=1 Tax=Solilutibacter tolerans TaxID=1604334 RepID=A0A1N6QFT1_9GAMM|nr:hydrolase [Lysobacter tolerans]SIQ15256.1 Nicotinamidase-related amidase [Lysobacter tolerans]